MATLEDVDRQMVLAHFDPDTAYFAAHQHDLIREHPDEWIAIYHGNVVGTSPDLDHLLADLRAWNSPRTGFHATTHDARQSVHRLRVWA